MNQQKKEENYFDFILERCNPGDVVLLSIDDEIPEKDEDGVDIIPD